MGKVLLVDDSLIVLKVLTRQLQDSGIAAEIESDATRLQVRFSQLRPALVLLDVNMPGFSGPEFCQAVRGETFVMLHSSLADAELYKLARSWGARGFIGKGWPWPDKLRAIQHRLSLYDARANAPEGSAVPNTKFAEDA